MTARAVLLGLALASVPSTPAAAQQASEPSLAEVARQADASKAPAAKAKKSYTNADLSKDTRGEPTPPPAPAVAPPTGFMSTTLGKPVSAEEMIARSEETVDQASGKAQSEEYWRGRADSLRAQIQKLQGRMTALTKPNEARDANPGAKTRNETEVAKVKQGLDALTKQWTTFEESARVARVPPEWLQPR